MPRFHRPPRTARVAESQVMGRSAVAVVVAFTTLVGLGELAGFAEASRNLDETDESHLTAVWAAAMVIGGLLLAGSYAARRHDDQNVLEAGACALIALVSLAHLVAVVVVTGWSGSTWVLGTDAALVVNCGGRAWFVLHQVWWVARVRGRA